MCKLTLFFSPDWGCGRSGKRSCCLVALAELSQAAKVVNGLKMPLEHLASASIKYEGRLKIWAQMKGKPHRIKWLFLLCLNGIVVGPVLVSHPFINSPLCPNACKLQYVRWKTNACSFFILFYSCLPAGPILYSRVSCSLCRFISLINAFLMTACVSKASSCLNFNTTTSAELGRWRKRERDIWIVPVVWKQAMFSS